MCYFEDQDVVRELCAEFLSDPEGANQYTMDQLDESNTVEIDSDGQPSEYDEWQDVYGGDDWDHGQFDGEEW